MFQHKQAHGFTIIELMLAMSFVSILLISIAMLTIQVSQLYTRGLTMKEINQVGTEVVGDIRRSMSSAYPTSVKAIRTDGGTQAKVFCTGEYSYIATNFSSNLAIPVKYPNGDTARLAKVRDSGGVYCSPATSLRVPLPTGAIELLGGGDRSLVVRNMTQSYTGDADRRLYTITLTLSSGISSELNLIDNQCLPPENINSGEEYCVIDTFSTVIAVGNKRS